MVPAMPATAEVDEGHQWIGASRGMVAQRDKGKDAACAGWAHCGGSGTPGAKCGRDAR
jgi:hypothetical protein